MKLSHSAKWGRSRNRKKEEEQPHLSTQFHGTFIEFIGVRDTGSFPLEAQDEGWRGKESGFHSHFGTH